mgnify:CR=1 FL=1
MNVKCKGSVSATRKGAGPVFFTGPFFTMKKAFKAADAAVKSIFTGFILKGVAYRTFMPVITSVLIVIVLMNCVFINAYVPTGSMESTIHVGNRVFGVRFLHNYKRGDIIVFKDPDGSGCYLIKRIIGMPNDRITIETGIDGTSQVKVNGSPLYEPYLKEPMFPETFEIEVPENGYFVLGDNRNDSYDARYWNNKIIPEKKITGIALVKYWPPQEIKLLR